MTKYITVIPQTDKVLHPVNLEAPDGMPEAEALKTGYIETLEEFQEVLQTGDYKEIARLSYLLFGFAARIAYG